MKPCWRDRGLTEEGAVSAERVIEEMMGIVAHVGATIAMVALEEARFRLEYLPKRTAAYQRRYKKENA